MKANNDDLARKLSIGAIAHASCEIHDAYADWADPLEIEPDKLEIMAKYDVVCFSRTSERSVADLSIEATEKLFSDNDIDPAQIDLIIYFHTLPTSTPAPPVSIINILRARHNIAADGFAISQQRCGSFHAVLKVIERMFLNRSDLETVLVVGADAVYDEEFRNISMGDMEGDCAVAALVHRDDVGCNVLLNEILTEGHYYASYEWNDGHPNESARAHYRTTGTLYMVRVIANTIKKSGIRPEEVKLVLTHNGSFPWWDKICEALKIPSENIFKDNNEKTAHLLCCDILINLKTCREKQMMKPGDYVFLLNSANGRSFGCAILQA